MNIKRIPLKQTILTLIFSWMLMLSCNKDNHFPVPVHTICETQLENPSGRSYSSDSIIAFTCYKNLCGILPVSLKNYWVYEDSLFVDGKFSQTRLDTLRFSNSWKSLADDLIWWQSNIEVGLPPLLYSNDSSLFQMNNRLFTSGIKDVKKEFGLFAGDSVKYLTSFSDDAAALGRSVKIGTAIKTRAGTFTNCLFFEKNARNYRRDGIYFSPGIGVVKYVHEIAPMGTFNVQLQKISTLIAFHIE